MVGAEGEDPGRQGPGSGPRVLLLHGAGLGNVGDSAQMVAAAERLERLLPGCRVVVARMYPEDDGSLRGEREWALAPHAYLRPHADPGWRQLFAALRRCGLRPLAACLATALALSRVARMLLAALIARRTGWVPLLSTRARSVVDAVRSCDAVYCSGGGNLNDLWLVGEVIPRAASYRLAAILGKPLVISGQGVGPLRSLLGGCLLRWGARKALMFGCRDYARSRELLLELGLPGKQVQSLGDEAIDLQQCPADRVHQILRQEGVPEDGRPLVAVHIRLHNFRQDFRAAAVPPLGALCDQLVDRLGCRLLFIPVTYSTGRPCAGDIADAFDVLSAMRQRPAASFLYREHYLPAEMKGVIAQCSLLLGFSYHAWVFAMSSGVPAFGLYSGSYFRLKASGLFDWYGRPDWYWDFDGLEPRQIVEAMAEAAAALPQHRQELLATTADLTRQVSIPARCLLQAAGVASLAGGEVGGPADDMGRRSERGE